MPDNNAGPDLVFFIQFTNEVVMPVLVQVKLRAALQTKAHAVSSTDPERLYINIHNKLHKNGEGIQHIMDRKCANGTIRLVIAYPSKASAPKLIKVRNRILTREVERLDLFGSIDKHNAKEIFNPSHLKFLNSLKHVHDEEDDKNDSDSKRARNN
jgi:hypothetical protein